MIHERALWGMMRDAKAASSDNPILARLEWHEAPKPRIEQWRAPIRLLILAIGALGSWALFAVIAKLVLA